MIGYICKYTPVEIIEAFGTPAVCMEPHVSSFYQADTLMHANMCSFTRAVLEDFDRQDFEGMVFTTCCDSVRRLFDTLRHKYPDRFFFCVDLPRKVNEFAVSLYVRQIEQLTAAYGEFSGRSFSKEALIEICRRKREAARLRKPPGDYDLRVGLAGARPGADIKNLIENHHAEIVFDLTCTGQERSFQTEGTESVLESYARSLLNQLPCMRMAEAGGRKRIIEGFEDRVDGIIYHTVKFCDIYSYEYAQLKASGDLPVLKVETDSTSQCAGQILTRLEAFLESLRGRQRIPADSIAGTADHSPKPAQNQKGLPGQKGKSVRKEETEMYVIGIDSGSTSTNAVLMNEKKEILAHAVLRTGAKSGESAERILKEILSKAGVNREAVRRIVSTGYGRVSIPFADKTVTEISCHARGAHFLNPATRTILDIGGQDSKAIRLNDHGDVADFVMNDKCAAGTGRFLEMMARTLEISIDDLGPLSLKSREDIEISSMCTVFAESEVISLIAQNKETADIAHGIHKTIAKKAVSLMKRVGPEPAYMMTGGVAKNPGVVEVLKEYLNAPLFIYEEPEIVGAIGAALYGLEELAPPQPGRF